MSNRGKLVIVCCPHCLHVMRIPSTPIDERFKFDVEIHCGNSECCKIYKLDYRLMPKNQA